MENFQSFIINNIKIYGTGIAWILVLFILGRFGLKKIVKKTITTIADSNGRAKTLGNVVVNTGRIVIYTAVLLMTLSLFGMDITPLLAGVGILGLAIGFGAQSLVKDFVSGLLILIENQYNIGDKVKIGSFEGTVSKITIRSTILRDDEGKTYYLSNGSINNVVNFSQK